jgi:hypothetical protein
MVTVQGSPDPELGIGLAGGHADGLGDQSSVTVEVCAKPATASSASRKAGGRSLPRLAARRRMPAQAFGLKK